MYLSKLFEMQAALDTHIEHEHPEIQNGNNLDWKILALIVELGECANEWRVFKKWSNDQQPRVERMLEEYVDCLHFILSIGNEIGTTIIEKNHIFYSEEEKGSIIRQFTRVANYTLNIINYPKSYRDDCYHNLFFDFLELGISLGFSTEQIEQAYIRKNEVNHVRQLTGY